MKNLPVRQELNSQQEKSARRNGEHSRYAGQNGKSIQASSEEFNRQRNESFVMRGESHRLTIYHRKVVVETTEKPDPIAKAREIERRKRESSSPAEVASKEVPPVRKKGDIQTFSKNSRRRLFETMNKIQTSCLSDALFLSLTYKHDDFPVDDLQYKFRKIFLPKLKEIIPHPALMWRLEAHKSGKPHFHVILWSFQKNLKIKSEYYKRAIRRSWRSSIDQHGRAAELYSCKIEDCDSYNALKGYVSKYLAKEPTGKALEVSGRRWGVSSSLPRSPITETGLTGDEMEMLIRIVKQLLKNRGADQGLIDYLLKDPNNLNLWLSPDEILEILSAIGRAPPKNCYENYISTGSRHVPDKELERMARSVGMTY